MAKMESRGISTGAIVAVVVAVTVVTVVTSVGLYSILVGPGEGTTTPTTTTTNTTPPTTTTPTTTTTSPLVDTSAPTVTLENDYYVVHYEWQYPRGWFPTTWTYDARIPKETYEYFSNKPRVSDYSEYVDSPADDVWIENLAHLFVEEAEKKGWGEFETVSFVLAFVQSWPYTSDNVTTPYDEYPRYPVETIVDNGGDCEDTSILFSSIVRGMGYGTVLLKLEEDDHMAVGVLISQNIVNNWNQSYSLTYYTSNGKIYAYCETTGEGWELGHKPEDLKSTTARLIPV